MRHLNNLFYQINHSKNKSKLIFLILFLALILRILLIFILPYKPEFDFQQEHYMEYIEAFRSNTLNTDQFINYEKRLFPGLIVTIMLIDPLINDLILSGILISLISFIICFVVLYKLTNKILPLIILSIFPPMWVITNVKSATETITTALLISSIYLFTKSNIFLSGLFIGIAFNFRPIAICLYAAILFFLLFNKNIEKIIKFSIGFLLTASFIFIYNYYIFGKDSFFLQFTDLNRNYGIKIGFLQIFDDIIRTISWGQYRIFFSGMFYILISFFALFILYKFRKKDSIYEILFLWTLFTIIFIFSLSPFTLIENYFRYILVVTPAIVIAFSEGIYFLKRKYIK